ncbi:MAG: UDP-N-acetylmuramoyl-tripeptide--D-alanyl-D-alanine ligase, partial [Clostridiales bacterium]|nr:UDP-N-acetylmuramoyl-tripeptide--D-alanyl-D-alanine ligase [Clostridiales bacterium]
MLPYYLSIPLGLVTAALCYPFLMRYFLYYQLSAYRLKELKTAVSRRGSLDPARAALLSVACFVGMFICTYGGKAGSWGVFSYLLFPASAALEYGLYKKGNKVKLKYTARFKRLLALFFLFTGLFCVLLALPASAALPAVSLLGLSPLTAAPLGFLAAHGISSLFENARNQAFIDRAAATLKDRKDVLKIGITGSAGKTTAKNVLTAMLSQKYRVTATEGNYNTPMGIALTVNNRLKREDRVFVAEMGARYIGDIYDLCRIVRPCYGFYTNIGLQHAETFGGAAAVREAKYELAQNLMPGGAAFFNGDNKGCRELYQRFQGKKYRYGKDPDNDARYKNVAMSEQGTAFDLILAGQAVRIQTPLLGEFIPATVTGCALLAHTLGISAEQIKRAAAALKPIAHRLQLLYNGTDVIIDDAYNGNAEGASAALRVLGGFSGRIKVIVTPGLVELGAAQRAANRSLGREIAGRCDHMIVLGPNADDLIAGAKSAGCQEARIHLVKRVEEAGAVLAAISG